MSLAELTNVESLHTYLRRFLRRESIESLVLLNKWILTALSVACVTMVVVISINTYLAVEGQQMLLQKNIQDKNNATKLSENQTAQKPSYSVITQKNIFGPLGTRSTKATTVSPPVKIPLTLVGVFLETGEDPYAIIEDDKKKVQDVFNINDLVFGDAKLVAIRADSVDIKRGSQIETLSLDDAPDARGGSSSSSGGEEFSVDSKELDEALENLPLLLTQARAVPYFKDGKSVGLRLFSIKSGSLYEKVGLQNGDILKSINGNSLSDITQAMKLFETLKQERSISVTLERNREDKEFKYQIR